MNKLEAKKMLSKTKFTKSSFLELLDWAYKKGGMAVIQHNKNADRIEDTIAIYLYNQKEQRSDKFRGIYKAMYINPERVYRLMTSFSPNKKNGLI